MTSLHHTVQQPDVVTLTCATDLRGRLDWDIVDPVDNYKIEVFLVHSLGSPILNHVVVKPKHRAVIIIDNCSSAEKEIPKDLPKNTFIFSAKKFMNNFRENHYVKMATPVALSRDEIISVMNKYEKDLSLYPIISVRDPLIQYFFGFHPPRMINTPKISVTTGIAPFYRRVCTQQEMASMR